MKVGFPNPLDQLVGMGSVIALVPSLSRQWVLWPRISCPRDGSLQWSYFATLKQCQKVSSPSPIIISLYLCRREPGWWLSCFFFIFEAVKPHSNPCTKRSGKGFFCPTTKVSLFKSPSCPFLPFKHSNFWALPSFVIAWAFLEAGFSFPGLNLVQLVPPTSCPCYFIPQRLSCLNHL